MSTRSAGTPALSAVPPPRSDDLTLPHVPVIISAEMQLRAAHEVEHGFLAHMAELDAAHHDHRGRVRPYLWLWLKAMLFPVRVPEPAPLPQVLRGEVSATFVGHATVLLRYARTLILTDPVLGRFAGGVPRVQAAATATLDLKELDLCLISHAHPDHLHVPSLRQLPSRATLVTPPGCAKRCLGLGFARIIELAPGDAMEHRGVQIIAVPARQRPARKLLPRRRIDGCGYIVRGSGPTVYYSGDTGYFSGFQEIGRRFRPDLAILPIGSYRPLVFRSSHLSPLDALYAFADLGARALLPVHHGTFPLSYEPPDEPARWLRELARTFELGDRLRLLEPGETTRLT
jgi:L-ascorbate metabolism protein UlaG (beta-lactamase superfamily)